MVAKAKSVNLTRRNLMFHCRRILRCTVWTIALAHQPAYLAWNGTGEFWNRYEAMERWCTTLNPNAGTSFFVGTTLVCSNVPWRGRRRKAIHWIYRFALHCERRDAARDMYKKNGCSIAGNFITPCFSKWACRFSACALILGLTPPWIKPYFFSWSFVDVRETNTFPRPTPRKKVAAHRHSAIQGLDTKIVLHFSDYLGSCSYSTRENLINDAT